MRVGLEFDDEELGLLDDVLENQVNVFRGRARYWARVAQGKEMVNEHDRWQAPHLVEFHRRRAELCKGLLERIREATRIA